MLQKAGGLFQLLAEVDFGTAYGVKSLTYKTRNSAVAQSGQFRLGNDETISWRNAANNADLELKVNTSNILEFDGAGISVGGDPVQTEITVTDTATIDLTILSNNLSADIVAGSITNSLVSGSAAIAYSKLNLSGSIENSDLVNMAQSTFKGRAASSGTGAPVDLTATQATAILNNFVGDSGSGGAKGLVPAPAAGDAAASKFLMADGSWTTPTGSGDVIGPATSTDNGFARFDGITGKLLKDSPATITNSDINASAAISYSKLNLAASIVNADIASAAAIAMSKLASLTSSRAVITDGSGILSAATTTSTEIGYVNGVTSAIQTQLNTKITNPMTTGGDTIYGGVSGTPTRLANGSAGQVFTSSGGTSAPTWTTLKNSYQYVGYDTRAGFGSTNTQIPYFTNTTVSQASGTTLFTADGTNTTLGNSFTVLVACQLTMTYTESHSATGEGFGISLNATGSALNSAGGLYAASAAVRRALSFSSGGSPQTVSVTMYCAPGDVVRAHTNNPANLGTAGQWIVTVFAKEL